MPKKLSKEQFVEKAKKIHGDKYDYSKVKYINDKTKVCIICPIHGEFWQEPHGHLKGYGCNLCGKDIKLTTDEYIKKANIMHGNKYDYSKCDYIGALKKVCIICPIHGEFWQEASSHIRGCGCPKCNKSLKLNKETFVEKAKKIHGDKYDYSKVEYVNNHTRVCIICSKHGEFWQEPRHHLLGNGCQKCNESNLERSMSNFLEEKKINYIHPCTSKDLHWLKRQHLDFYLPDYNIAIECQGIQHFQNSDHFGNNLKHIQELDVKKFNLCKKNDIKLIYYSNLGITYPYNVYENKDEIIKIIKNE